MARKLYKTKSRVISLAFTGLVIPGKKDKVYLSFSGGVESPFIPSTLIVEDTEVQKVLERHASFGIKFELAKTFKEPGPVKGVVDTAKPVVAEKAEKKFKKVGQVKNLQGAITYLIKLGADGENIDTLEDVLGVAKNMGIEFTQLKSD